MSKNIIKAGLRGHKWLLGSFPVALSYLDEHVDSLENSISCPCPLESGCLFNLANVQGGLLVILSRHGLHVTLRLSIFSCFLLLTLLCSSLPLYRSLVPFRYWLFRRHYYSVHDRLSMARDC